MQVFISGTDTNIGKTMISSWIALHTGFSYFKPIQTGEDSDSIEVDRLSGVKVYPESFCYKEPVSPHLAARLECREIDMQQIMLPQEKNLIVEGAGGLLVPLNHEFFLIDLIQRFQMPVILVASTRVGTINHTLLSLEALNKRGIRVLGVIMNGPTNLENRKAIEFYGNTEVIAEFPQLNEITRQELTQIHLPGKLKHVLRDAHESF